jgi:hypothetical protein
MSTMFLCLFPPKRSRITSRDAGEVAYRYSRRFVRTSRLNLKVAVKLFIAFLHSNFFEQTGQQTPAHEGRQKDILPKHLPLSKSTSKQWKGKFSFMH